MNNYNINEEEVINSEAYNNFLNDNPGRGNLKIRAYAASSAIPISGLRVIVSKKIDDNDIIFFNGYTNESGVIEKISLPTPKIDSNNLTVPKSIIYDVVATYIPNNLELLYKINMYDGICVVQNINIVPDMNNMVGGISGS